MNAAVDALLAAICIGVSLGVAALLRHLLERIERVRGSRCVYSPAFPAGSAA